MIAIHQSNIDKLRDILDDVSDMGSPNYGKHLTKEEVASMTADPLKTKTIIDHFTGKGAKVIAQTPNGEYITMRAPIALWEETFSAAFEEVELASGERVLRSHSFSIPEDLFAHIAYVENILQVQDRINSTCTIFMETEMRPPLDSLCYSASTSKKRRR